MAADGGFRWGTSVVGMLLLPGTSRRKSAETRPPAILRSWPTNYLSTASPVRTTLQPSHRTWARTGTNPTKSFLSTKVRRTTPILQRPPTRASWTQCGPQTEPPLGYRRIGRGLRRGFVHEWEHQGFIRGSQVGSGYIAGQPEVAASGRYSKCQASLAYTWQSP